MGEIKKQIPMVFFVSFCPEWQSFGLKGWHCGDQGRILVATLTEGWWL